MVTHRGLLYRKNFTELEHTKGITLHNPEDIQPHRIASSFKHRRKRQIQGWNVCHLMQTKGKSSQYQIFLILLRAATLLELEVWEQCVQRPVIEKTIRHQIIRLLKGPEASAGARAKKPIHTVGIETERFKLRLQLGDKCTTQAR